MAKEFGEGGNWFPGSGIQNEGLSGCFGCENRSIGSVLGSEASTRHVPGAGILFQGDLMNAADDGSLLPGNSTTAHFAQWLERSGLEVRTIRGVHSPARTKEELARAVETRVPK